VRVGHGFLTVIIVENRVGNVGSGVMASLSHRIISFEIKY